MKQKILAFFVLVLVCGIYSADASTTNQNFDTDPSWVDFQNKINGNDFGFSNTDNTGGASPAGEAGGVWGAPSIKSYYGDIFGGPFSLNDAFFASGELVYVTTSVDFNWEIRVGYFSSDLEASTFIGFSLLESCGAGCYFPDIGRVQAQISFADGSYSIGNQFTLPLNTPLTWHFAYDPAGNGTLTFTLDGIGTSTIVLTALERAQLISVDAFGLSSAGGIGTGEAYFDNLTYNKPVTQYRPLPDTSQTTSYTATFGEDSDYIINSPSYTLNGDGTTTDNVTGLMWQNSDDDIGYNWYEASGTPEATYNPSGAVDVCGDLNLAGHEDWRLPSKKDFISIVNYEVYNPAIDQTYFPGVRAGYWSYTTYAENTSLAWYQNFFLGLVGGNDKATHLNYVLCVRGDNSSQNFTDNADGTVTDLNTGLTWQQEDDNITRIWERAITYCEDLELPAGQTDWRLPNIKELESISDDALALPAIDETFFPGTQSQNYWSSTTNASFTPQVWGVSFNSGYVGGISGTGSNYVRCVRGPDQINDTDNDGITDDIDNCPLIPNTDQSDNDSDDIGDVCDPDDDNDGMPDDYEIAKGFDPFDASDSNNDPDGDGLTNLDEYNSGTDPQNPDTDGDGVYDGYDGYPLDDQQSLCLDPVRNALTLEGFTSVQAAIDDLNAADNDIIQITAADFGEDVLYERNIILTLSGGWYCDFADNPSTSSIESLTISDGTVNLENIVIRTPSCDIGNILLCSTKNDCTAAGGFWWSDNTCMGVSESETVVSAGGRIWMDRNLGSTRVATSSTDSLAYGDLYQWGRGPDGHQLRTSGTTSTTSSTDDPGHGDFILATASPYDYRVPQNPNLWQGVSSINNVCPAGFRLPTNTELETERLSWSTNDFAGAFTSPLKLVVAGYRYHMDGTINLVGNEGVYWSSTVFNGYSHFLRFKSNDAFTDYYIRANGFSVRCIKD